MYTLQMSAKRRLSDGSRQRTKQEIKQKKQRVLTEDPPVAWLIENPFVAGTVRCGIDPFDIGRTFYNDCVPDASRQLRQSILIETNRSIVWLMPSANFNCETRKAAWEPVCSLPLMHYTREPLVVRLIEEHLPVQNGSDAILAELVYSYVRSRGISYLELWATVRALFNEPRPVEARQALRVGAGTLLCDTFHYSSIVDFQIGPSYDGESVVVYPVFELVHRQS